MLFCLLYICKMQRASWYRTDQWVFKAGAKGWLHVHPNFTEVKGGTKENIRCWNGWYIWNNMTIPSAILWQTITSTPSGSGPIPNGEHLLTNKVKIHHCLHTLRDNKHKRLMNRKRKRWQSEACLRRKGELQRYERQKKSKELEVLLLDQRI